MEELVAHAKAKRAFRGMLSPSVLCLAQKVSPGPNRCYAGIPPRYLSLMKAAATGAPNLLCLLDRLN